MLCFVCFCKTRTRSPSSVLFISLEITVSALLVFEVLLRMMAFKRVRGVSLRFEASAILNFGL